MSILTRREHDVLSGVARGERNKEIAARLGISGATVKTHLASVFYKLNVDSRASAVAVAMERGILSGTSGNISARNICFN
jgi:NarL family two-component system response regulator YdfI